jgi:probable phosphoglycerate mutase
LTLLALLACRPPAPAATEAPAEALPEATVFVVRHAEKATGSEDPSLTEEGAARAARLASLLSDVELVGVHSTDTTRTRETARPTAEHHGLTVELYDPPEDVVDKIVQRRGAHLVVGHSNTVPSIVGLLDPQAEAPPIDDTEYNRLYMVVWTEAGATTSLLRYGSGL